MLFWNKVKLSESGILNGFTDWHSHILPGVDDGVRKIEDSIRILEMYESLGVRTVWCTPHIKEDFPNTPAELEADFNGLRFVWKGNVELHLASENMVDIVLEERLEQGMLLPLGNGLLVETSFFSPPVDLEGILDSVRSRGLFPVLAHPERYGYMTDIEYERLKEDGVLFQLNIPSLTGLYGSSARDKAEKFLKRGWYDLAGLDLHSYNSLKHILSSTLSEKYADGIASLRGFELIEA